MLIPSHRHTAADLKLWAELEYADRIHGDTAKAKARADRSMEVIRRFVAAGPCYLATSWGKESTVISHLLWQSELPIIAVRFNMPGIETPGADEVRDAFLCRFPIRYEEIFSPHNPKWERLDGFRERALEIAIAEAQRRAGTKRYVNGLRAGESFVRKVRMARLGLNSDNSCSPIGWWNTADVFGYLARHNLPTHANYAMLGGGRWERERLRVCMLGNHKGRGSGRLLWETEYYGDVLRRMKATHANLVPD